MNGPSKPRVLMCSPEYFGIEYEINLWMNRSRQADHRIAMQQWEKLCSILQAAGAIIDLVEPVPKLPDLVFTANAALIYKQTAVLSHFRHRERQGEEPYYEAALQRAGFQIEHVPDDMHFEGAGDALFCGDTLFAGYRIRSDALGHQHIARMLECRVIPLELVDGYFYHLDTCFCPIAPGIAAYFPDAFDSYGQQALINHVEELIPVNQEEARRFACNAVVVGRAVITNSGCPMLHRELQSRGYTAIETPLNEFVKAGGSAKCLTLRLDGEEAAGWKTA